MHGIGFERPLQEWFDFKIQKTRIKTDLIQDFLQFEPNFNIQPTAKILWLGGMPLVEEQLKTKRGVTRHQLHMTFHDTRQSFHITLEKETGDWLLHMLELITPHQEKQVTFSQLKTDFENRFEDFELFWFSKPIKVLKEHGLLVL
jgi:hypothetical protein